MPGKPRHFRSYEFIPTRLSMAEITPLNLFGIPSRQLSGTTKIMSTAGGHKTMSSGCLFPCSTLEIIANRKK